MQKSSRKWIFLGGAILVAAAVAWFVSNSMLARANTRTVVQSGQITRGDIEADVLSSAALQPASDLTLTFGSAGTLEEIKVKPGERVEKGWVLAKLDSSDLNLAVTQAQANIKAAQAKLDALKIGPSAAQQSAAQLRITQAQSSLTKVKSSSSMQRQQAELNLHSADRAQQTAQDKYNAVAAPVLNSQGQFIVGLTQEQIDAYNASLRSLNDAKDNYTKAQLALQDAQLQETQNVASAQAQLDDANAQLKALTVGPTEADTEAAQSQLEQAQGNLEAAKLKLQNATLTAPFAGVVAAMPVVTGQTVGANTNIMELVDDSAYHLDMNVGEADIQQIKLNQPVNITFDALGGTVYTGTVTYVAPVATVQQGVVSYPATVTVDPKVVRGTLRPGMSASASVVVDRHTDALLVPNRAVRTEGRQKVIYIVGPGGAQVRVPVQTGITDDTSTEIVGDTPLRDGDSAVVNLPSTTGSTVRTGSLINLGGGTGGTGRRGP